MVALLKYVSYYAQMQLSTSNKLCMHYFAVKHLGESIFTMFNFAC